MARQPILTGDEKVFGYELLFRDGIEDYFRSTDPEAASRSTLDTSILMGLDMLCDGKRAFINCTREILLKDYVTLLPSAQTVVEILEMVPADDLVKAACQRLKEGGYLIALDDFSIGDPREPLTDLADIIKVDMQRTPFEVAASMVKRYGPWRSRLLAEKVETRDQFLAAKKSRLCLFPGILLSQARVNAGARDTFQPFELRAHVAGGFASRARSPRGGRDYQERSFALLPFAALLEFRRVRVCQ